MCGIVGYTGGHQAEPILVAGLRRLEYRGYDSAGLATLEGDRLHVRKCAGRVERSRSCSIASRAPALAESATPAGPLTVLRRTAMRIPIWVAEQVQRRWPSCTTA